MMNFTNDEMNLMAIYNAGSRAALMDALCAMCEYLEDETELRDMTDRSGSSAIPMQSLKTGPVPDFMRGCNGEQAGFLLSPQTTPQNRSWSFGEWIPFWKLRTPV